MGATPTFDLYVDDSGTSRVTLDGASQRDDGLDAFALGGFICPSEAAFGIRGQVTALLDRFGLAGPLDSTRIRSRSGPYLWPERAASFYRALEMLVEAAPIHCLAAVAHRPGYARSASFFLKDLC